MHFSVRISQTQRGRFIVYVCNGGEKCEDGYGLGLFCIEEDGCKAVICKHVFVIKNVVNHIKAFQEFFLCFGSHF